jgi:hypothetical protein
MPASKAAPHLQPRGAGAAGAHLAGAGGRLIAGRDCVDVFGGWTAQHRPQDAGGQSRSGRYADQAAVGHAQRPAPRG